MATGASLYLQCPLRLTLKDPPKYCGADTKYQRGTDTYTFNHSLTHSQPFALSNYISLYRIYFYFPKICTEKNPSRITLFTPRFCTEITRFRAKFYRNSQFPANGRRVKFKIIDYKYCTATGRICCLYSIGNVFDKLLVELFRDFLRST